MFIYCIYLTFHRKRCALSKLAMPKSLDYYYYKFELSCVYVCSVKCGNACFKLVKMIEGLKIKLRNGSLVYTSLHLVSVHLDAIRGQYGRHPIQSLRKLASDELSEYCLIKKEKKANKHLQSYIQAYPLHRII